MKVVDFPEAQREILAQHPLSSRIGSLRRSVTTGVSFSKGTSSPCWDRCWISRRTVAGAAAAHPGSGSQQPTDLIEECGGAEWRNRHPLRRAAGRIGEETHVGEWLQINQGLIDQFAAVTGIISGSPDPGRAAAESPFKTIAHGFLTLALLPQLTGSVDGRRRNSRAPAW